MLTQGQGIPAVRCPDRHRRRLHEVSAGRTEGARNSISLVQPPHHAEPEMTSPPCAFAHRLFPDLRRRRSKHPVGPSAPGRRRTCPPRTALSSRRLGRDRRPVEVRDVPVANRSPRSAYLTVGRGPTSAPATGDLHRVRFPRWAPDDAAARVTRRTDGVHGADIRSAPTPRTSRKSQNSNVSRWDPRRRPR